MPCNCCWSCGMAISQSCPICQVCQVYYLPCVIIIPSLCLAMLWSSGVCKCQSGRYAILLHSDRNVFSPLEGVLIYPVPELVWSTCWSYCSWYSTWNSGHLQVHCSLTSVECTSNQSNQSKCSYSIMEKAQIETWTARTVYQCQCDSSWKTKTLLEANQIPP